MTDYRNFIQDFPVRCHELLDRHFMHETYRDREVTLLLSITTAAFVIPYERLRYEPNDHLANDAARYQLAKAEFSRLREHGVVSSGLLGGGTSWEVIRATTLDSDGMQYDPITYWNAHSGRQSLPGNMPVKELFAYLRNALAHANIFTVPEHASDRAKIQSIVFVSEHRPKKREKCKECGQPRITREQQQKYDVLLVSPQDLRTFLKQWIEFLAKLDLGGSVINLSTHVGYIEDASVY